MLEVGTRFRLCHRTASAQHVADHLTQNLAIDLLVRPFRVLPPPAIALHRSDSSDEATCRGLKVFLRIVETEDDAASSDPAQRQPFCSKIELEHPVIPRWLGI